ncbi:hypothetical protein C8Q76DRAFT_789097 [Earliella scabrosa]|nr:hypothetical protein C8Q76DRAFT_789097 [Earliella scabrosa]
MQRLLLTKGLAVHWPRIARAVETKGDLGTIPPRGLARRQWLVDNDILGHIRAGRMKLPLAKVQIVRSVSPASSIPRSPSPAADAPRSEDPTRSYRLPRDRASSCPPAPAGSGNSGARSASSGLSEPPPNQLASSTYGRSPRAGRVRRSMGVACEPDNSNPPLREGRRASGGTSSLSSIPSPFTRPSARSGSVVKESAGPKQADAVAPNEAAELGAPGTPHGCADHVPLQANLQAQSAPCGPHDRSPDLRTGDEVVNGGLARDRPSNVALARDSPSDIAKSGAGGGPLTSLGDPGPIGTRTHGNHREAEDHFSDIVVGGRALPADEKVRKWLVYQHYLVYGGQDPLEWPDSRVYGHRGVDTVANVSEGSTAPKATSHAEGSRPVRLGGQPCDQVPRAPEPYSDRPVVPDDDYAYEELLQAGLRAYGFRDHPYEPSDRPSSPADTVESPQSSTVSRPQEDRQLSPSTSSTDLHIRREDGLVEYADILHASSHTSQRAVSLVEHVFKTDHWGDGDIWTAEGEVAAMAFDRRDPYSGPIAYRRLDVLPLWLRYVRSQGSVISNMNSFLNALAVALEPNEPDTVISMGTKVAGLLFYHPVAETDSAGNLVLLRGDDEDVEVVALDHRLKSRVLADVHFGIYYRMDMRRARQQASAAPTETASSVASTVTKSQPRARSSPHDVAPLSPRQESLPPADALSHLSFSEAKAVDRESPPARLTPPLRRAGHSRPAPASDTALGGLCDGATAPKPPVTAVPTIVFKKKVVPRPQYKPKPRESTPHVSELLAVPRPPSPESPAATSGGRAASATRLTPATAVDVAPGNTHADGTESAEEMARDVAPVSAAQARFLQALKWLQDEYGHDSVIVDMVCEKPRKSQVPVRMLRWIKRTHELSRLGRVSVDVDGQPTSVRITKRVLIAFLKRKNQFLNHAIESQEIIDSGNPAVVRALERLIAHCSRIGASSLYKGLVAARDHPGVDVEWPTHDEEEEDDDGEDGDEDDEGARRSKKKKRRSRKKAGVGGDGEDEAPRYSPLNADSRRELLEAAALPDPHAPPDDEQPAARSRRDGEGRTDEGDDDHVADDEDNAWLFDPEQEDDPTREDLVRNTAAANSVSADSSPAVPYPTRVRIAERAIRLERIRRQLLSPEQASSPSGVTDSAQDAEGVTDEDVDPAALYDANDTTADEESLGAGDSHDARDEIRASGPPNETVPRRRRLADEAPHRGSEAFAYQSRRRDSGARIVVSKRPRSPPSPDSHVSVLDLNPNRAPANKRRRVGEPSGLSPMSSEDHDADGDMSRSGSPTVERVLSRSPSTRAGLRIPARAPTPVPMVRWVRKKVGGVSMHVPQ